MSTNASSCRRLFRGSEFRLLPLEGEGSRTRTGVLGNFFIGAHAAILRVPVLTRDVARYESYFRDLKLVMPDP